MAAIERPYLRIEDARGKLATALYREGVDYSEIMEQTGLTYAQVMHRIRQSGEQRTPTAASLLSARRRGLPLPTRTPIGALVRRFRERAKWSSNRLGSYLGDSTYISRIERGQRCPSPDYLQRLAQALQLSAAELDQLRVAAGYAPVGLTDWSPSLSVAARTMGQLQGEPRQQFEAQIKRLADWYLSEAERANGAGGLSGANDRGGGGQDGRAGAFVNPGRGGSEMAVHR
jgi:transcriptional regulator with XRE-family HTH domain